jgi:hypothetical protein
LGYGFVSIGVSLNTLQGFSYALGLVGELDK